VPYLLDFHCLFILFHTVYSDNVNRMGLTVRAIVPDVINWYKEVLFVLGLFFVRQNESHSYCVGRREMTRVNFIRMPTSIMLCQEMKGEICLEIIQKLRTIY
jgi:ATP/ADP translocase